MAAARAVIAHGVAMRSALRAISGRTWARVPSPQADVGPSELAAALGVVEIEAEDLLKIAPPPRRG